MWAWAIAAAGISAAGTWLARRYALRRRLVDEPGERRSHSIPTPRGGGIGPVLAVAMLILAFGTQGALRGVDWRWLLAGLLGVAAIGAWDDHRPLGAGVRLAVHALAGIAMAAAFGALQDPLPALLVVLAVAVAINVWNFMDGIDGIACTQAVIVAAFAGSLAAGSAAVFCLAVSLAVLAFLPYNFPRARVFLGDVGSGALGYAVVMLALILGGDADPKDAALVLFPAAAFLVDASLTLGLRIVEGERWWSPHTRHLYQVAARRLGHVPVTLAYGAWSISGAGIAHLVHGQGTAVIVASLALWYTTAVGLWMALRQRLTDGVRRHEGA